MTKREFLKAIISNDELDVNLIAFAENELEKLDKRNTMRSSKPSKTQLENESIKNEILEVIKNTNEKITASGIQATLTANGKDFTTQKISALCRQLAEEGKIEKTEIKVPKKGKQKAYSVIEAK